MLPLSRRSLTIPVERQNRISVRKIGKGEKA